MGKQMKINGVQKVRIPKSSAPRADSLRDAIQRLGEASQKRMAVAMGVQLMRETPGGLRSPSTPAEALADADGLDAQALELFDVAVLQSAVTMLGLIQTGQAHIAQVTARGFALRMGPAPAPQVLP